VAPGAKPALLRAQGQRQEREPTTGRTWPCVRAFLTFVAIDASGSPQRVPPLLVETDAERALAADAASRRAERLSRRPSPIKAPPTRG
jgi:acyl-CoA hydrolase